MLRLLEGHRVIREVNAGLGVRPDPRGDSGTKANIAEQLTEVNTFFGGKDGAKKFGLRGRTSIVFRISFPAAFRLCVLLVLPRTTGMERKDASDLDGDASSPQSLRTRLEDEQRVSAQLASAAQTLQSRSRALRSALTLELVHADDDLHEAHTTASVERRRAAPVSYTHLTLPTILLV